VRDLAMQQEKLERKFRHLARHGVGSQAAERMIDICRGIEREPDIRRLLAAAA
jgi:hypothetical protein